MKVDWTSKVVDKISTMDSFSHKCKNQLPSKDPNWKSLESSNIVGDIMWPIIFVLKFGGHSPLKYEKITKLNPQSIKEGTWDFTNEDLNGEESSSAPVRQYKFRFRSYWFVWSTFCALWTVFSWSHFLHESMSAFGAKTEEATTDATKYEKNWNWTDEESVLKPEAAKRIGTHLRMVMPVVQISELLFSWIESRSLAKFLNGWAPLQKQFYSVFPCHHMLSRQYSNLDRTKKLLLLIYVALPTTLFVPFMIATRGRGTPFLTKLVTMFPHTWHLSTMSLMEDVKVLMTYRILAEAFSQIRDGMNSAVKLEKLTTEKVKMWKNLVHCVRLQVEQAGQSQKLHQLVLTGGSIVSITISVFLLVNIPWKTSNSWVLATSTIAFLSYQVGRLYLKILFANLIVQEERLIANDIVLVKTDNVELEIQLELAFIHDMIMKSPSVISFGGYFTLNKGLLLSVGSQVVTYLIVLLQFKN